MRYIIVFFLLLISKQIMALGILQSTTYIVNVNITDDNGTITWNISSDNGTITQSNDTFTINLLQKNNDVAGGPSGSGGFLQMIMDYQSSPDIVLEHTEGVASTHVQAILERQKIAIRGWTGYTKPNGIRGNCEVNTGNNVSQAEMGTIVGCSGSSGWVNAYQGATTSSPNLKDIILYTKKFKFKLKEDLKKLPAGKYKGESYSTGANLKTYVNNKVIYTNFLFKVNLDIKKNIIDSQLNDFDITPVKIGDDYIGRKTQLFMLKGQFLPKQKFRFSLSSTNNFALSLSGHNNSIPYAVEIQDRYGNLCIFDKNKAECNKLITLLNNNAEFPFTIKFKTKANIAPGSYRDQLTIVSSLEL